MERPALFPNDPDEFGYLNQARCAAAILGPADAPLSDDDFLTRLGSVRQWASESRMALRKWQGVLDRLESVMTRLVDACPFVTVVPDASPIPSDRLDDFTRTCERLAVGLRFLCLVLEHQCQSDHLPKLLPELLVRLLNARDDAVAELALRAVATYVGPRPISFPFCLPEDDMMFAGLKDNALYATTLYIAQSWYCGGAVVPMKDALGSDAHVAMLQPVVPLGTTLSSPTAAVSPALHHPGVIWHTFTSEEGEGEPQTGGRIVDVVEDLSAPSYQGMQSWQVFDSLIAAHRIPVKSSSNPGLLWRVRKAVYWRSEGLRARMVRLQLYSFGMMVSRAAMEDAIGNPALPKALLNIVAKQPSLIEELVDLISLPQAAEGGARVSAPSGCTAAVSQLDLLESSHPDNIACMSTRIVCTVILTEMAEQVLEILANSVRGSEVSRIEMLVLEAGRCFLDYVQPEPVTPGERDASAGNCGLIWPASAIVHPYWVIPDRLRLCIQLYRMANRMLNAYESPVLTPWFASSNIVLQRKTTYPAAFEVYYQTFRLQIALIRAYDGKLLPFMEQAVEFADFLSGWHVGQATEETITVPAPESSGAAVVVSAKSTTNGVHVDGGEEEFDASQPRKQARVVTASSAPSRTVTVCRVPRASLYLRGVLASLLYAMREYCEVLKRETAAIDFLLGSSAAFASSPSTLPPFNAENVASPAVVLPLAAPPSGFLVADVDALSSRSSPVVFRQLSAPNDTPFLVSMKRVFANVVSFGSDVYCAACSCFAGLACMEFGSDDLRLAASGLYHAMVAPIVYRSLPVLTHLTEAIESLKVPNYAVPRCVMEGLLDALVDEKCLGRGGPAFGPSEWFTVGTPLTTPQSTAELMASAHLVLQPEGVSMLRQWVPSRDQADETYFRLFRPYNASEAPALAAAAAALPADAPQTEKWYYSNIEYGLLWEMYGIGSSGGTYNDRNWHCWIGDPSLATTGFSMARLECVVPIVDIVTDRLRSLVKTTEAMWAAGNAASGLLPVLSSATTSAEPYERLLSIFMSETYVMLWQAVKNMGTVLKEVVASVDISILQHLPAIALKLQEAVFYPPRALFGRMFSFPQHAAPRVWTTIDGLKPDPTHVACRSGFTNEFLAKMKRKTVEDVAVEFALIGMERGQMDRLLSKLPLSQCGDLLVGEVLAGLTELAGKAAAFGPSGGSSKSLLWFDRNGCSVDVPYSESLASFQSCYALAKDTHQTTIRVTALQNMLQRMLQRSRQDAAAVVSKPEMTSIVRLLAECASAIGREAARRVTDSGAVAFDGDVVSMKVATMCTFPFRAFVNSSLEFLTELGMQVPMKCSRSSFDMFPGSAPLVDAAVSSLASLLLGSTPAHDLISQTVSYSRCIPMNHLLFERFVGFQVHRKLAQGFQPIMSSLNIPLIHRMLSLGCVAALAESTARLCLRIADTRLMSGEISMIGVETFDATAAANAAANALTDWDGNPVCGGAAAPSSSAVLAPTENASDSKEGFDVAGEREGKDGEDVNMDGNAAPSTGNTTAVSASRSDKSIKELWNSTVRQTCQRLRSVTGDEATCPHAPPCGDASGYIVELLEAVHTLGMLWSVLLDRAVYSQSLFEKSPALNTLFEPYQVADAVRDCFVLAMVPVLAHPRLMVLPDVIVECLHRTIKDFVTATPSSVVNDALTAGRYRIPVLPAPTLAEGEATGTAPASDAEAAAAAAGSNGGGGSGGGGGGRSRLSRRTPIARHDAAFTDQSLQMSNPLTRVPASSDRAAAPFTFRMQQLMGFGGDVEAPVFDVGSAMEGELFDALPEGDVIAGGMRVRLGRPRSGSIVNAPVSAAPVGASSAPASAPAPAAAAPESTEVAAPASSDPGVVPTAAAAPTPPATPAAPATEPSSPVVGDLAARVVNRAVTIHALRGIVEKCIPVSMARMLLPPYSASALTDNETLVRLCFNQVQHVLRLLDKAADDVRERLFDMALNHVKNLAGHAPHVDAAAAMASLNVCSFLTRLLGLGAASEAMFRSVDPAYQAPLVSALQSFIVHAQSDATVKPVFWEWLAAGIALLDALAACPDAQSQFVCDLPPFSTPVPPSLPLPPSAMKPDAVPASSLPPADAAGDKKDSQASPPLTSPDSAQGRPSATPASAPAPAPVRAPRLLTPEELQNTASLVVRSVRESSCGTSLVQSDVLDALFDLALAVLKCPGAAEPGLLASTQFLVRLLTRSYKYIVQFAQRDGISLLLSQSALWPNKSGVGTAVSHILKLCSFSPSRVMLSIVARLRAQANRVMKASSRSGAPRPIKLDQLLGSFPWQTMHHPALFGLALFATFKLTSSSSSNVLPSYRDSLSMWSGVLLSREECDKVCVKLHSALSDMYVTVGAGEGKTVPVARYFDGNRSHCLKVLLSRLVDLPAGNETKPLAAQQQQQQSATHATVKFVLDALSELLSTDKKSLLELRVPDAAVLDTSPWKHSEKPIPLLDCLLQFLISKFPDQSVPSKAVQGVLPLLVKLMNVGHKSLVAHHLHRAVAFFAEKGDVDNAARVAAVAWKLSRECKELMSTLVTLQTPTLVLDATSKLNMRCESTSQNCWRFMRLLATLTDAKYQPLDKDAARTPHVPRRHPHLHVALTGHDGELPARSGVDSAATATPMPPGSLVMSAVPTAPPSPRPSAAAPHSVMASPEEPPTTQERRDADARRMIAEISQDGMPQEPRASAVFVDANGHALDSVNPSGRESQDGSEDDLNSEEDDGEDDELGEEEEEDDGFDEYDDEDDEDDEDGSDEEEMLENLLAEEGDVIELSDPRDAAALQDMLGRGGGDRDSVGSGGGGGANGEGEGGDGGHILIVNADGSAQLVPASVEVEVAEDGDEDDDEGSESDSGDSSDGSDGSDSDDGGGAEDGDEDVIDGDDDMGDEENDEEEDLEELEAAAAAILRGENVSGDDGEDGEAHDGHDEDDEGMEGSEDGEDSSVSRDGGDGGDGEHDDHDDHDHHDLGEEGEEGGGEGDLDGEGEGGGMNVDRTISELEEVLRSRGEELEGEEAILMDADSGSDGEDDGGDFVVIPGTSHAIPVRRGGGRTHRQSTFQLPGYSVSGGSRLRFGTRGGMLEGSFEEESDGEDAGALLGATRVRVMHPRHGGHPGDVSDLLPFGAGFSMQPVSFHEGHRRNAIASIFPPYIRSGNGMHSAWMGSLMAPDPTDRTYRSSRTNGDTLTTNTRLYNQRLLGVLQNNATLVNRLRAGANGEPVESPVAPGPADAGAPASAPGAATSNNGGDAAANASGSGATVPFDGDVLMEEGAGSPQPHRRLRMHRRDSGAPGVSDTVPPPVVSRQSSVNGDLANDVAAAAASAPSRPAPTPSAPSSRRDFGRFDPHVCPPGMDPELFFSLPVSEREDIVAMFLSEMESQRSSAAAAAPTSAVSAPAPAPVSAVPPVPPLTAVVDAASPGLPSSSGPTPFPGTPAPTPASFPGASTPQLTSLPAVLIPLEMFSLLSAAGGYEAGVGAAHAPVAASAPAPVPTPAPQAPVAAGGNGEAAPAPAPTPSSAPTAAVSDSALAPAPASGAPSAAPSSADQTGLQRSGSEIAPPTLQRVGTVVQYAASLMPDADPAMLAAMPPEILQEMIDAAEASERRRVAVAAAASGSGSGAGQGDGTGGAGVGGGSAGGGSGGGGDDLLVLLTATRDEGLRREMLAQLDDAAISRLPAGLQAEARLVRDPGAMMTSASVRPSAAAYMQALIGAGRPAYGRRPAATTAAEQPDAGAVADLASLVAQLPFVNMLLPSTGEKPKQSPARIMEEFTEACRDTGREDRIVLPLVTEEGDLVHRVPARISTDHLLEVFRMLYVSANVPNFSTVMHAFLLNIARLGINFDNIMEIVSDLLTGDFAPRRLGSSEFPPMQLFEYKPSPFNAAHMCTLEMGKVLPPFRVSNRLLAVLLTLAENGTCRPRVISFLFRAVPLALESGGDVSMGAAAPSLFAGGNGEGDQKDEDDVPLGPGPTKRQRQRDDGSGAATHEEVVALVPVQRAATSSLKRRLSMDVDIEERKGPVEERESKEDAPRTPVLMQASPPDTTESSLFDRLVQLAHLKHYNSSSRHMQRLFSCLDALVSPLAKFAQKHTAEDEAFMKDAVMLASLTELLDRPRESATSAAAVQEQARLVLGHLVMLGTQLPPPVCAKLLPVFQGDSDSTLVPITLVVFVCDHNRQRSTVPCRVQLRTKLETVVVLLSAKIHVPAQAIKLLRNGEVLDLSRTVHSYNLENGDVLTWQREAEAAGSPLPAESPRPDAVEPLACDSDDGAVVCCGGIHSHVAVSGVAVTGRRRPVKVIVNMVSGRVQFGWEPLDGYVCPVCTPGMNASDILRKALATVDPPVPPADGAEAAPVPHLPSRVDLPPRMNRGELLRHLQRFHAHSKLRDMLCPICAASSRSTQPTQLMSHLTEHASSVWYGGRSTFGPVPTDHTVPPSALELTMPELSKASVRTLIETLAMDCCTDKLQRTILHIVDTFSCNVSNAVKFRRYLSDATSTLCKSSMAQLTALRSALRSGTSIRSLIAPEPPTSDRFLLGAVQMLLTLPVPYALEVLSGGHRVRRFRMEKPSTSSRLLVECLPSVTDDDALSLLFEIVPLRELFATLSEILRAALMVESSGADEKEQHAGGGSSSSSSHALEVMETPSHAPRSGRGELAPLTVPAHAGAHVHHSQPSPGGSSSRAPGSSSTAGTLSHAAQRELLAGPSALSPLMSALVKRFSFLVECFFLLHPVNDVSPYRTRQKELWMSRLRDSSYARSSSVVSGSSTSFPRPDSWTDSVVKRYDADGDKTRDTEIRGELIQFVETNAALINAIVSTESVALHWPSLSLAESLSPMVRVPACCAVLNFSNKRAYFREQLSKLQQSSELRHNSISLPVRRDRLFEDSYERLRMLSAEEMRGKIVVTFEGEKGADAGGLRREWYSVLAREMFNPSYALFMPSVDSPTFQPNPLSFINGDHLSYFKFVGRIIGKAILDEQPLDAHFTRSFYKHMLGVPVTYHDIESVDPVFYKSLRMILDESIDEMGLGLTFSADRDEFGVRKTDELIPGGDNVEVTDANKREYIRLIAQHRLTSSIRAQIDSFLEGLQDLVPRDLLSIFNENELELLVSGMPTIDLDDLKANTEYHQYEASDSIIQWFWKVLKTFSQEELARLIQFVTGTSKVPLDGFAGLQGMSGPQKFQIHRIYGGDDRLPTAHTCFNQLDLPNYSSEEVLRARLLLVLREGSEGFGFV